jgi:nitrate reductase gamma subunit
MYGTAPTGGCLSDVVTDDERLKEILMYIGGGILGTILVIALIVFLVRRA